MLLSVVIPTRNRSVEVGRAIRSVLDQDVPLEVIVVDDASTDGTPGVLDRLADADGRVKPVRSESQLGPCESRNLALDVAQGEFVGFCDDDDAWLPGVGRHSLEYLQAHADVHAVSSWHDVVHVELQRTVRYRGPLVYGHHELLWQNFAALPFGVVRRAGVPFDLRFDPALPAVEDWDLWLRCARERPMHTVPRVGYAYTQHGGSRVSRSSLTQTESRRTFVAKHRDAMEPACRLFHEAVLAGYDGGPAAMLRTVASATGYAPGERAFALSALSVSVVAGRVVGPPRRDPGLQARLLARLVAHPGVARRARRPPVL
jgi:hypothetical protein